MFRLLKQGLMLARARWRWYRGRCPLCNRNVYATFPYYMADYPDCPVCKDETETDLRMWHKHRAPGPAKGAACSRHGMNVGVPAAGGPAGR